MHAHGHAGQQDALVVSQLASRAGMAAILWKTLGSPRALWLAHCGLVDTLARWAERARLAPTYCAFGAVTETPFGGPTVDRVREAVDRGAAAIWLPVITNVNSLVRVGAPGAFAGAMGYLPPMTVEQAVATGGVTLLDRGRLRPEIADVVRLVADRDVALFSDASPDEALALAEHVERLGFRKAVVDHPFSPILGLSVDQLRHLAAAGVSINWTYDELSPMLGVDPQDMVAAIQAIGPEHYLLSSDAGDPILPHSVECMRLMVATMAAYGLPSEAVRHMAVDNPSRLLGLAPHAAARAA